MRARVLVAALALLAAIGCDSPTTPPVIDTSAPSATSGAATSVTTTSATLNGTTTPNGLATEAFFEWGTTAAYGTSTPVQSAGNGTIVTNVTAAITGLSPGTAYNYRLVARNSAGTANGANQAFTTTAAPPSGAVPTVTTTAANGIGPDDAKANGTVRPNGLPTDAFFEWGTTSSYGNTTTIQQVGDGSVDVAVTATLTGLALNTTYHYRLVARNSAGSASGANQSFTTATPPPPGPGVPTATTGGVTNITPGRAIIHATVTPNGLATEVWFQWGLAGDPGVNSNVGAEQAIGSGTTPVSVSREIDALAPNATYRYRVLARNSAGTTTGEFLTFQSSAAPEAETRAASSITASGATLNAQIRPRGLDTEVFFEWGTTTSYGNTATAPMVPSGNSSVSRSASITGLSPSTTYHFRVVARSSGGTTHGANFTFTTAAGLAPSVTAGTPTAISSSSVTINGTVNPNGLATEIFVRYGDTTSLGIETSPRSIGSGSSAQSVSVTLTGLSACKEYHYVLLARNSAGRTGNRHA